MTISRPVPLAAIWPEFGLPDEVTEILCDAAEREGREFVVMWLPGECPTPKGESILSTMIDSPCASISFVHDHRGATWLTWQIHAGTAAGARRVDPSDEAEAVFGFCYRLLLGTDAVGRGIPACH